jgi:hypothetical protein
MLIRDLPPRTGCFLYNNFKQAVENLDILPAQLEEAKKILDIEDEQVFAEWRWEEKAYLPTLEKELPADLLKMQYLKTLKKLLVAEYLHFFYIL